MKIKKLVVTPDIANRYLLANSKNRNVKKSTVIRYAKDMKEGRWKEDTGECIKISKTGALLDGQHRLLAIIMSETTVILDFIFELEDSVFDVIDTGSSRTASDVFKIDGVKNANIIPSMIAFYHKLNNKLRSNQMHNKLTNSETLSIYQSEEDKWQEIIKISLKWYSNFSRVVPPSWIGGFFATFSEYDEVKAKEFMEQLFTGNGITNGTINLLRKKLIDDKLATKKLNASNKMALFIKTWNSYLTNKQLKRLAYTPSKEEYPIILRP